LVQQYLIRQLLRISPLLFLCLLSSDILQNGFTSTDTIPPNYKQDIIDHPVSPLLPVVSPSISCYSLLLFFASDLLLVIFSAQPSQKETNPQPPPTGLLPAFQA
jgi:hypothetical protein